MMKRHVHWLSGTLGFLALPFCLVSCDKKDPGLVEKLSLIEAELREKDARLEDTQLEMARMSKATAAQETSGPDIAAARSSYSSFIDGLREKVAGELTGANIERTSVFPIEGPDPAKPILSKVAFRIVGANGRTGELMIPLYADPSGKWQEPAAEDIAAFQAGLDAAPKVTQNVPTAPAPAPRRPDTPKDVMGANRTIEVEWDDPAPVGGNGQAQAEPQSPAPQPPAAPELPKKVMPTSRDVIIDFE
jgi:hypothetical protein